jgi:type II secretory pathway component PulF
MLLYPVMVLVVGFLVLVFLFSFVIPQLQTMIPSDQTLPMISRVVFGMAWLFQGWGLAVLMGSIVGLVATVFLLLQSKWGGRQLSKLLAKSRLYRKIRMQLFSLAMAMCSRVGLDMTRSLTLGCQVLGNPILTEKMNGVIEDVRRGHTLTDSLEQHEFNLIPLDSLEAGEQTGNLEDVFRFHAELLEREIDEELTTMVTLLEHSIIAAMAVFVGLIMAAVMLPIFQLSSAL